MFHYETNVIQHDIKAYIDWSTEYVSRDNLARNTITQLDTTLQEHQDDSKKVYDEKAAKNCPSYLIWSIFTRRREMQIVHSLEGRKGNSQGRPGVLSSTQGTNKRDVRSAPALLNHSGQGDLLLSSLCSQACNVSCRNAVEGWNGVAYRKTGQKVTKYFFLFYF